MTDTLAAGGCRCGRVRFTANGGPARVGVCHCESCRRATGSPFATYVDYPAEAVSFAGEPSVWSSRPGVERLFCAACGTPIGFRDDEPPALLCLYLGAFAKPEDFMPTHVSFPDEALGWVRRALEPILAERGS